MKKLKTLFVWLVYLTFGYFFVFTENTHQLIGFGVIYLCFCIDRLVEICEKGDSYE